MVISATKIKILIVMHPSLFRRGIEYNLALHQNMEYSVIPIEKSLSLTLADEGNYVAIVDVDLANSGGYQAIKSLKKQMPGIRIIALTSNYNDDQLYQVLKAQANACLKKDISGEELLSTIRDVAEGANPIQNTLTSRPNLADHIILQFQRLFEERQSQGSFDRLTMREREILIYLAHGLMNRQIAQKLRISEQTIKNHVTSILRKLDVNSRSQAVTSARNQGFILE